MSIKNLFNRYALNARAQGDSEVAINHIKRVVGYFDEFLGGIGDVNEVIADDLRRYIVYTQEHEKWPTLPQASGQKLSETILNTYVRAIKGLFKWLVREEIIKSDPFEKIHTPKLPKQLLPKVMSEREMAVVFDSAAGNPTNYEDVPDCTLSSIAQSIPSPQLKW